MTRFRLAAACAVTLFSAAPAAAQLPIGEPQPQAPRPPVIETVQPRDTVVAVPAPAVATPVPGDAAQAGTTSAPAASAPAAPAQNASSAQAAPAAQAPATGVTPPPATAQYVQSVIVDQRETTATLRIQAPAGAAVSVSEPYHHGTFTRLFIDVDAPLAALARMPVLGDGLVLEVTAADDRTRTRLRVDLHSVGAYDTSRDGDYVVLRVAAAKPAAADSAAAPVPVVAGDAASEDVIAAGRLHGAASAFRSATRAAGARVRSAASAAGDLAATAVRAVTPVAQNGAHTVAHLARQLTAAERFIALTVLLTFAGLLGATLVRRARVRRAGRAGQAVPLPANVAATRPGGRVARKGTDFRLGRSRATNPRGQALNLAVAGASTAEIAARTRMSRDAVRLVVQRSTAAGPDEAAGSGRLFRPA